MGEQSCVVLTGFILLHVAFILNVIALSTPYWVYAPTYNHSIAVNGSAEVDNSTTKGLWQLCVAGDCDYFHSPQPGWFNGIRISFTVGVAILFVSLVLEYLFFLISRFQNVLWFNAIITVLTNVASIIIIITIALMCKWSLTQFHDLLEPRALGWSCFMAIGGMVFTFFSGVLVAREMCMLLKEPVLYQDL